MRAGLHVAMNRLDDARALIAESRKADTANAGSYDVEALLLDRNRQGAEARTAYAKAVELNSQNFYSHYRAASTDLETTGPAAAGLEKQVRRAFGPVAGEHRSAACGGEGTDHIYGSEQEVTRDEDNDRDVARDGDKGSAQGFLFARHRRSIVW